MGDKSGHTTAVSTGNQTHSGMAPLAKQHLLQNHKCRMLSKALVNKGLLGMGKAASEVLC